MNRDAVGEGNRDAVGGIGAQSGGIGTQLVGIGMQSENRDAVGGKRDADGVNSLKYLTLLTSLSFSSPKTNLGIFTYLNNVPILTKTTLFLVLDFDVML